MLEVRKALGNRISKYMEAGGYRLSPKSKNHHALDSFVYEYQNAGGMKDNLKIEINYTIKVTGKAYADEKGGRKWTPTVVS